MPMLIWEKEVTRSCKVSKSLLFGLSVKSRMQFLYQDIVQILKNIWSSFNIEMGTKSSIKLIKFPLEN